MRTLLLAAVAALTFASSAWAVPPVTRQGPVQRVPTCLTHMCDGQCMPKGYSCHKLPPNCRPGSWPCGQTCIPNGTACHR